QVHLAMLAGLLGNVGLKSDEDDWDSGARGIRFWRHPGAHLSKKPGRWIVAAELVETTRLFGRSIAAIEPQWLPQVAAHRPKRAAPPIGGSRPGVCAADRRARDKDAAARAALGEEGGRGRGARARHAVRHR